MAATETTPASNGLGWRARVSIAVGGYIIGLLVAVGAVVVYIAFVRGVPPYQISSLYRWVEHDSKWLILEPKYGVENAIFISHAIGSATSLLLYLLVTRRWGGRKFNVGHILITTTFVAVGVSIVGWSWELLVSRPDVAPDATTLLTGSAGLLIALLIYRWARSRRVNSMKR